MRSRTLLQHNRIVPLPSFIFQEHSCEARDLRRTRLLDQSLSYIIEQLLQHWTDLNKNPAASSASETPPTPTANFHKTPMRPN